MIIVGGTYAERCVFPHWDHIFGSGLRAAVALSRISKCTLHSYVNEEWIDDVSATLESFQIDNNISKSANENKLIFDYLYSFENLTEPKADRPSPPIEIEGDVVLRFGMLEGDAHVKAHRVVFDPQYAELTSLGAMHPDSLALVLNSDELLIAGLPEGERAQINYDPSKVRAEHRQRAIQNIQDARLANHLVIVVKHKFGGADVYIGDDEPIRIPAYSADTFFKLGSGDIFSAAFAYAWAERGMTAAAAAKYASLCSAHYAEGRQIPLQPPEDVEAKEQVLGLFDGTVVLSGPISETNAELLRHAESSIERFGGAPKLTLTSPRGGLFEVGAGDVVLGLFERRSAASEFDLLRSKIGGRKLIAYWPSQDVTLEPNDNVLVTADYGTAIYLAMRESR